MTMREFDDEVDDTLCACFRAAAIREAWQASGVTGLLRGFTINEIEKMKGFNVSEAGRRCVKRR
jgi:hypothetical protein